MTANSVGETGAAVPAAAIQSAVLASQRMARYRWAAQLLEGRNVFEAQCGVGDGTSVLARAGRPAALVAMDEAAARLEVARGAHEGLAEFKHGVLSQLAEADGSFEVVLLLDLDQERPDLPEILAELGRILTSDGLLVTGGAIASAAARELLHGVRPNVAVYEQLAHLASMVPGDPAGQEPACEPVDCPTHSEAAPAAPVVGIATAGHLPRLAPAIAVEPIPMVSELLRDGGRQAERLRELQIQINVLTARDDERRELRERLIAAERSIAHQVELQERVRYLEAEQLRLQASERALDALVRSSSWRMTRPLRTAKRWVQRRT